MHTKLTLYLTDKYTETYKQYTEFLRITVDPCCALCIGAVIAIEYST